MVKFVKPTVEMLESIAADMRQADVEEIWASDHHSPLESLVSGWEMSQYSTVVVSESNEPLAIIGLVKRDILSGSGVVWMLSANKALKYRKEFLRQTKPVIDEMLTICPRLCNMVHGKNKTSIKWLRWLGFTIEDPVIHGPEGELFHRFHLEVTNYV